MDPLSVTASVLTVLGAAGTVLRSLEKTRSFRKAPEEVHALIEEVSDLRTVLGGVETLLRERRENDRSLDGALLGLSVLLGRAKNKLLELDSVVHYRLIKHQHTKSGFEVARSKWVREKSAVASIQQALRDIRLNLATALGTTAVFDASEVIFRLEGIQLHIEELKSGQHRLEDQNRGIRSDLQMGRKMNCLVKLESTQLLDTSEDGRYRTPSVDIPVGGPRDTEAQSLRNSPSLRQATEYRFCCCRCHTQRTLRSLDFLSNFMGSFSVRVGSALMRIPQTCDERTCQHLLCHQQKPPTYQISYFLPSWLLARMIQLKLDGPRFSLNLPRVVPTGAPTFAYASRGDINGIQELFRQGLASPYDVEGLRSENSQYQKDRSSVAEHLRQALEASSASINAVDAGGETPLIWAVRRGDGKAVQTLLTYGADPNIAARHRSRPIHIAYTSLTCLEALLSSKVEVDARDAYNRTALHTMAYSQTDTRSLQLLLGAGADINARNKRGITALSAAVRGHRSENVRFLLQHRADPNTLDGLGYTPLFDSIYRNNHQSLELLFEFGADHTFWTSELGTVLHEAAWKGDIRTLQILTETRLAGIDIYLTDHDDRTALDKLYKRPDFTHELELAFLLIQHSYMKYLYKYPQKKFPYEDLVVENAKRGKLEREYQLIDTGVFKDDRYWDIFIETAKETDDEEELLFRVTAYNRGPESAPLHIVPHVWFRNTWTWGHEAAAKKPSIRQIAPMTAHSKHWKLGDRFFQLSPSPGIGRSGQDVLPRLIFTENDSNFHALYGTTNPQPYVKDAFHRHIVNEQRGVINPHCRGTKSAAWYAFDEGDGVAPGECAVVRFRLSRKHEGYLDEELFDDIIEQRGTEADEFFWRISPLPMADDLRNIQRQALSGMLWTKQYYHFIWEQWANGDPAMPPPPPGRKGIRNQNWKHMYLDDVLSMPDSWEYPFFAAWDTAFHCIPLAMIDPEFAKKQLDLLTREWYMHPNGQLPAYEWNFGDVNPPVHAWSVFRTFKIERKMYGRQDLDFLERVFQKLLLNFTWWVNRKDFDGKNVFEGGFLGLDNIGLFNRSEPLLTGGVLEQADSTGWMAFYCLSMLNIALELAKHRRTYEDIASKFFEHFILISDAMTFRAGEAETSLWNDKDGFYYDAISWGGPWTQQLPVRSLVGLIPLYAVLTLEPELINKFPSFRRRVNWFIENRNDVAERNIASMKRRGKDDRLLLSLVSRERLEKILKRMLDETEFLADHGIRSLSKYHKDHPYSMNVNGQDFRVDYVPGDSDSGLFGGNSNWRGPIWLCVNFLLVESLLCFYMFYGNSLQIECPTGSGDFMHLGHVAEEIQHRLQHLLVRGDDGRRAVNEGNDLLDFDPHWRNYLWFYEFFDADSGRGLGATHQCGWSGLIAKMIHDTGINCRLPQTPRTPSTAANHYFDDIFSRSMKSSSLKPHHIRRSSTSRSIGHRSSFNTTFNGDNAISHGNSVGVEDHEQERSRSEANDHVANYVADQLERIRSNEPAAVYEDEFEAQLDGQ